MVQKMKGENEGIFSSRMAVTRD